MAYTFKNCPPGWEVKTIEDVFEVIRGVSFPTSAKTEKADEYVGCLRTANVQQDIVWDDLWHVPIRYMHDATKLVREHDIIISIANSLNLLGKTSYVHFVPEKSTFGTFVANLRAKTDRPKYLYYFLQSRLFLDQVVANASTTTNISNISTTKLKNLHVLIPEIEEQDRIITKIEELLSQLNEGAETLKKTQAQLEVYRQAVLKEAFEKANAEECRLEDLCFFITKGTTPSKDKMIAGKGDVPFIKVYNLTFDNSLDFSIDPTFVDEETHTGFLSRSIVRPGDVLMNIVGPPMGKVSIVPDTYAEWNINQAIARFRCLERLSNKYLAYYLGYAGTVEKLKRKAKATAGQFNLTLEICRDVVIPLPSLESQKQIVFEIETRLSQCEQIQRTVELALQQAEAMRQSILKKAFEGRL